MKHRAVLLVSLSLVSAALASSKIDVRLGEVQSRVVSGPDEDGDLEIAIMVPVENMSDVSIDIGLEGQALDREGFEVFEFELSGTIQAGSVEVVSDTDFIDKDLYPSIRRWRVQNVDMSVALAPGSD